MLFKAIFYGFLWGFAMCFTLGPAFFSVLYLGTQNQLKKAQYFTFGVCLADLVLSLFAVFASNFLNYTTFTTQVLTCLSAIFLLVIGLGILFSDGTFKVRNFNISPWQLVSSGFLLNISNPMNTLFFISTTATLKANYFKDNVHILLFFLSSLLATYMASVVIMFGSKKLGNNLQNSSITWLKYLLGVLFIGLSLRLIFTLF
jgi:threonine/homoserine/homoserine lactone efflux protein